MRALTRRCSFFAPASASGILLLDLRALRYLCISRDTNTTVRRRTGRRYSGVIRGTIQRSRRSLLGTHRALIGLKRWDTKGTTARSTCDAVLRSTYLLSSSRMMAADSSKVYMGSAVVRSKSSLRSDGLPTPLRLPAGNRNEKRWTAKDMEWTVR